MLTLALVILVVPALIAGALSSLAPKLTFHDLAAHVASDTRLGPRIPSLADYAQALKALTSPIASDVALRGITSPRAHAYAAQEAQLHQQIAAVLGVVQRERAPLAQNGGLFSGSASAKSEMEAFERAIGAQNHAMSSFFRSAPQQAPTFHASFESCNRARAEQGLTPLHAKPPCDCKLSREP